MYCTQFVQKYRKHGNSEKKSPETKKIVGRLIRIIHPWDVKNSSTNYWSLIFFSISFCTEQCTMCQMYFVRDPCSDISFMLRHRNSINVFCSQSCQSHFVHKYRMIETCVICRRYKSNFNMIKNVITDTRIHLSYCSMKCLQIVELSSDLEQASLKPIENKTH